MKTTILKNIALSLFSLLITFLFAETVFRFYTDYKLIAEIEMHKYTQKLKRRSKIPGLSHEHVPQRQADLMGVTIKTNNLGFRGPDVSEKKSPDELRTLFLGCSITLGWGMKEDQIFTSLIEQDLKKKFPNKKVSVINSGIGNYNTYNEEILLKHYFDSVHPDLVCLHYFVNDAEIITKKENSFFVKNSYLIAFLYVRLQQILHLKTSKYKDIGDYYLDMYHENSPGWVQAQKSMLSIKSFCDSHKIPFLVFVQPSLHNLTPEGKLHQCHKIIQSFLTKASIPYQDFFNAFSEKFQTNPRKVWIYPDDSHPNSEGHHLMYEQSIKPIFNTLSQL